MRAKLLAVVGTDTGVGKTVIGAGLLHGLKQRGLRVAAFKPVETGLARRELARKADYIADPGRRERFIQMVRASAPRAEQDRGA